ncbi:hypothetical protein FRC03_005545 [Tulasnella sp. 419]|nr:hypothetical protein FRC03_005545 [Tulasnella sp. 419]
MHLLELEAQQRWYNLLFGSDSIPNVVSKAKMVQEKGLQLQALIAEMKRRSCIREAGIVWPEEDPELNHECGEALELLSQSRMTNQCKRKAADCQRELDFYNKAHHYFLRTEEKLKKENLGLQHELGTAKEHIKRLINNRSPTPIPSPSIPRVPTPIPSPKWELHDPSWVERLFSPSLTDNAEDPLTYERAVQNVTAYLRDLELQEQEPEVPRIYDYSNDPYIWITDNEDSSDESMETDSE